MTAVLDAPRTPAPASTGPFRRRSWLWAACLAAVAVLAACVRLRLLTHAGGLVGSDGYDDGVYYAAADALVHGRLPYRDFLFLQPPGSVVALTPFAWFGSVTRDSIGSAVARLCFLGVGAFNATLVMRIGRRFGAVAAVIAGVGYAVAFPAAYSERSTLLEPLGTCALLGAVLLAARAGRRPRTGMLLAGVVAGFAPGMRIWYVLPVLLIAAFHLRSAPRFLIGAAASTTALCLPFFAASPAVMVRQVLLDQLGRQRLTEQTPARRIASVLGALDLHLRHPLGALLSPHKVEALLLVVVVVCAVAALRVPGARLYPLTGLATMLVLLASPSYYVHYGAFAAPWLILTVAIGAASLLSAVRARWWRAVVVAVVLLAFSGLELRAAQVSRASSPIPAAALRPVAQRVPGCVVADDPQILTALDLLSRDLQRGCTVWPDVTGATYDRDTMRRDGEEVPRDENPLWQADVARYLLSGEAVIVHRDATQLDPSTNRLVRSGPVLLRTGNWTLHAVPR